MAGKYISVGLHLVWSTKGRRQLLARQSERRLKAYIGSVIKSKKGRLIEAGNEPDHIHLYVSMPSTISIAELINAIKSNSTRWIRRILGRRLFAWQEGYGAFSVSKSMEQVLIGYIRNQEKHHRRRDFKAEFLELLRRHRVDYDPRYIWD